LFDLNFKPLSTVEDDHPAHAAITDQDISAASQDRKRHLERPKIAHRRFQIFGTLRGQDKIGLAANARCGVIGQWNVLAQSLTEAVSQLCNLILRQSVAVSIIISRKSKEP